MWTYKVLRSREDLGDGEVVDMYEIVEAYKLRDEEGWSGWCNPFMCSESIEGLRTMLKRMESCLDSTILKKEDVYDTEGTS